MLMSRQQTAGQNRAANKSFQNVEMLKYLGTAVTNDSCIHEEIKSGQNSGISGYRVVQNLLSSRLRVGACGLDLSGLG
jgi:hypothetical protein